MSPRSNIDGSPTGALGPLSLSPIGEGVGAAGATGDSSNRSDPKSLSGVGAEGDTTSSTGLATGDSSTRPPEDPTGDDGCNIVESCSNVGCSTGALTGAETGLSAAVGEDGWKKSAELSSERSNVGCSAGAETGLLSNAVGDAGWRKSAELSSECPNDGCPTGALTGLSNATGEDGWKKSAELSSERSNVGCSTGEPTGDVGLNTTPADCFC